MNATSQHILFSAPTIVVASAAIVGGTSTMDIGVPADVAIAKTIVGGLRKIVDAASTSAASDFRVGGADRFLEALR